MDLVEEVGESSSPPRGYGDFGSGGGGNDAYNRLVESGKWEVISNPDFREQLEAHFNRLPPSYGLDINMDRVEDVLLHQKLLERAKDSVDKPVFHIRFLEIPTKITLTLGMQEERKREIEELMMECCC